jgi:uncharacterized protein YukE
MKLAKQVNMAVQIKSHLDFIEKMKPDGKAILNAAEAWYAASAKYQKSMGSVDAAWYDLGATWDGPGFELYEKYMRFHLAPVTQTNKDVFFNIGNTLVDIYNQAVNGYNDAVQQIGDVVEKASAIDPDKNMDAIETMIHTFAANIVQRKQTLTNTLQAQQGKMAQLAGQLQQIRSPGAFPQGLDDKNKWKHAGS